MFNDDFFFSQYSSVFLLNLKYLTKFNYGNLDNFI